MLTIDKVFDKIIDGHGWATPGCQKIVKSLSVKQIYFQDGRQGSQVKEFWDMAAPNQILLLSFSNYDLVK